MDIKFVCPHCNQRLRVDSSRAGRAVRCPTCKEPTRAPMRPPAAPAARPVAPPPAPPATPPPASPPEPPPQSDTIFCTKCGQPNIENNYQCTRCGFLLHGPARPPAVVVDDTFSGLIPYKNSHALAAYYFGIFSLIPCVGIPLGITALILGILGLKHANEHPEAKGKVHAWVGVVLGALTTVVYILIIVISIIIGALE